MFTVVPIKIINQNEIRLSKRFLGTPCNNTICLIVLSFLISFIDKLKIINNS